MAEPRPLSEDGYLQVEAAPAVRSIVYHPSLNVILICGGDAVRVVDVNSGVVLQASRLAAANLDEVSCKYIPGDDRVLFCDGRALGVRSNYNGVLLLDSILQTSVTDPKQKVKVEIPLSEAIILKQSLLNNGLGSTSQVLTELTNVIATAQKQSKKGIKAQKWNTICLEVPLEDLRGSVSTVVSELLTKKAHTPELQVASAVNERLSELNGEQTNAADRKAMASEARRRDTFSAWPHMDYKWALPAQMAQAGFYHQPNSAGDDRAMCFTCTVCLVCWERTDEPWAEHERHSPNCPFVIGEYTQNVPISVTNATAPAIDATYRGLNVNVLGTSSLDELLPTSNSEGLISVFDVSGKIQRTHSFYVTQFDSHILEKFTADFGSPGLDKTPVEKKITALSIVRKDKDKDAKSKNVRPTIICGLHIRSKSKIGESTSETALDSDIISSVLKPDVSRVYLVVYDFMYSKDQEETDEKPPPPEEKDSEMQFEIKTSSIMSAEGLLDEDQKDHYGKLLMKMQKNQEAYNKLTTFLTMDTNESPYSIMKQWTSFYKTLIPGESDQVFVPPLAVFDPKKHSHTGPRLLAVDVDTTEADSSSAADLLNSLANNSGNMISDSYELSISDHIADLKNTQSSKKLNYSRAVQCISLPDICRESHDLRITDILPTHDLRHVLVVVLADSDTRGFMLLYALDFSGKMVRLCETPAACGVFTGGETPVEVRLLPAAADKARRGDAGAVGGVEGSAAVVCADGAVRVVELDTMRTVCCGKIEREKFVSATYCTSMDRLCASTIDGSLHFFTLNDAEDEFAEDRDEDDLFGIGTTPPTTEGPSRSHQRDTTNTETMHCFAEPPSVLPLEELRTFKKLCGFTPLRAGEGYSVAVPPCWSEFQQAMRQRRHPSPSSGPGSIDPWTKTWRLQTDTTTWEEHVFEITLPQATLLGHVDVHFALQAAALLPHVEVTLLRQTKSGIGHGRDVKFAAVDDNITIDMMHWVENPVTSEEYLRAHNADILAGPVNIAQHLDLTEQSGTVTLTSPKMFKVKVRNLLLHIRAVYKKFDASKSDKGLSGKRTELYMGCDCIHELSLAVYVPQSVSGVPQERQLRVQMLESNAFVQSLITTAVAPDCTEESLGLVLDVLAWVASVRLTRNRGSVGEAPNHQLEFMFINGVDENMRGLLKRCLLLGGRSVAHKCMRYIVTCCSGVRNICKPIGEHFNSSVAGALLSILDSIYEVQSAAGLQWLFCLLLKVCGREGERAAADRCVALVRDVAEELGRRANPYHLLLRSRYGLYGTPTEPELFDIETLSVYSKLVSANENTSNIDFISNYGFNKETISPRDVLSSNEMKVKCKNFISMKIIKGLIETQPLHFTCASTSEGTRLERADITASMSNMISPILPSVTLMESLATPLTGVHDLAPKAGADKAASPAAGTGSGSQQEKNGGEKPPAASSDGLPPGSESGHSKWITQMLEEAEQVLDNKYDMINKSFYYDPYMEEAQFEPMIEVADWNPTQAYVRPQTTAAQPPTSNLPWQQLLTAPPKQVIVVERMQSGARRHVTLEFGEPVILTDILIPSCYDLVSLTIDVWLMGEEIDAVRIATATDIGSRILLLNDLQPPPLCRFLKITMVGRYGMSTTRCRIPLGYFYGHVVVLPEEIQPSMFIKPVEVDKQIQILSKLFEDISCRYSLSCSKLKDLLQPYLLADMKNIVHLSNYMNILKERNRSVMNTEHSKIFVAYQEAIVYQHQLNTVRNVMKRLEGSLQRSQIKECTLQTTSTDKLIHIAESLLEVLLSVETTPSIDIDACRRFFDGLCVSQTSRLQLLGAIFLEKSCGNQPFWGSFLSDTLVRLFSTSCTQKFPQDRLFVLMAYLSRKSPERSAIIDAALRVVHEALRPVLDRAPRSLLLAVDVDLPLLSWLLMYLSLQLGRKGNGGGSNRWDWVLGEMGGKAGADGAKGGSRKKTYKRIAPTIISSGLPTINQLPAQLQSKLLAVWQKQAPPKADKAVKLVGKKTHGGGAGSAPPVPPAPPSSAAEPKPAPPRDKLPTATGAASNRRPREVDPAHCLAVARGLLRLMLSMDHSASADMMLLSFKVTSRLIGLAKLQLCQLLNESELLALVDFCISCRIPWPMHAVSCFLLDSLELSSNQSQSDIIEMDTDTSASASGSNWNQNEAAPNPDLVENYCEIIDDDLVIVKTKANRLISKLNSVNPLPSVFESEDSEYEDHAYDFEKIKSPLWKSIKSSIGTPNNFSTTIDARLETGVSASAEIQLIRLVAKHTSRLIVNVMAEPKQKESDNPLTPWPSPPPIFLQETTLSNHRMLANCFEKLFENMQNQDPFKIEQILSLWLTVNCPTKADKFDKSHVPAIQLSTEAVSSLMSALAWTPGLSMAAWCAALQVLTLACNTNGGKRWTDPVTGIAEAIIGHKDFEQMFLSLLSGSGLAVGKVLAGPTLCKCLHEFLARIQMRCDVVSQSSRLGGILNLHLLNIVYQLTKVGGPVASKLGPLDAQSKLLQLMQYMNFYNIDISIGMSIFESTAVLFHNYVVQADKIKCWGIGDKQWSNPSNFSDIFANVLGTDTNKTDRAVSYDDLLISLMKLLGRLVQTPIRSDQSEAMETETTPSGSSSQTDESKAEQINNDPIENTDIPNTTFFADTVLQHQPTIVRLCKCLAACKSSSLCMLVKVFKKVPFWNLSEPNTVGDALFHILTLLALKASNKELLMRPLLTFLSQTPQLSEPMVWFILQVLDSEAMIKCFFSTGGIEILCAGVAASANAPPTICRTGTISTVIQHFSGRDRPESTNTTDAQQSSTGVKKSTPASVDRDAHLINFAPYCTITCQSGNAQPPEVLVQSAGMVTVRRSRTALWSYHYFPEEIHTELLLQLPIAILLKEVQLQPHTGTLSTCPSFVGLETSAYGPSRLTPACQPLPTSGLTFIQLQLPTPRVTDCILLRLYKPRDSSSIGMLQIRVLGTHAFGTGAHYNQLEDDEYHCRHSLGWLRLLHHAFTIPSEPSLKQQIIEAASRVPNLLSICCGLLLVPSHILPDYLPCLEKVLKELALHNTENSLNAIRVLLDNRLNIIEPMLSLDNSWQDRLMINVSGYQSACELLYQICEHQDNNTGYRVQLLLRWFQNLASETLQANTNKCNAAYVSSIASILWAAKNSNVTYNLEELISTELFDCTYNLKMQAFDNISLKYALDSLLCSICYIQSEFFPLLLQRIGVLVPNLTTDHGASISDDRKDSESMTDDNKRIFEVNSEWYGRLVIGELSDLRLSKEQLETVALASRSPTAVQQLLDSGLPKLLNRVIYEFSTGGEEVNAPMAKIEYVTAILQFFTDVSDEKIMRDWLGSPDGSSFWPHLLHWLCRKTNNRTSSLQSEAHVQLEEVCVKFLSKCSLCHPTNQTRLAKVLCEVISHQQNGISGFLRRLVLQLLLENEKVPVSIEADDTLYKCSMSTQTYLPNHPAFKQSYNRATLYLSTGTTLWDILDQHVYFNYAMKLDSAVDSKKSMKKDIKQYFGVDVSDLSMAAGVTAKDKRAKDLKNQMYASSTPQTKKKRYTSLSSDGIDNFNILVKCSAISEQPLPPSLSLGQLLRLIEAKGTSVDWPCVHLSVWQSKGTEEWPSSEQHGVDNQPPPQPVSSALQVFSQMGGLALLAQHLPAVYPETSRSTSVAPSLDRSTTIMGSDSDWIKVDECDDTYEDYATEGDPSPTKSASLVSHIPHHSLAAFSAFLRLPGYAEVLLRDARRALCLLRLALGVTDDGEGGDIFQLSIAHSLPTLPFEVLQKLYDSTPLCSDDGRLLRRISITSGVIQLLLMCLGIFTHHSNGNGDNDPSKDSKTKDERQLYWAKGTGFGTGSTQQCWNVEQALLKQKNEEEHVTVLLRVLAAYISPSAGSEMKEEALPAQLHDYLANSALLSAISSYLRNDSVLDMARHIPLYKAVLEILRALATSPQLVDLLLPQKSKGTDISLCSLLKNMKTCVDTYASKLNVQNTKVTNPTAKPAKSKLGDQLEELEQGEGLATLMPDIRSTAGLVADATDGLIEESDIERDGGLDHKTVVSLEEQYLRVMKGLQFGSYEMIQELSDGSIKFVISHHFETNAATTSDNSHPARVKRIAQETVTLSTSLPLNYSSSVFVRYDTSRLDVMKVLITGPADTPYANGCFELDVFFPSDYPLSPMLINLETTGHHSVRFNPNLYNDGKVCLSVLNTWHGRPEEKWNSQTSSFLQVLVSIQSLILVPEPYFNEPGFERTRGTPAGNASSRDYNLNVYQATVRWAMLDQIVNPCPCFKEVIHAHFYMKRDEIIAQVDRWTRELEAEVKKDNKTIRASKKNPASSLDTFQKICKQLKAQLNKLKPPEGFEEQEEEEELSKTPTNSMDVSETMAVAEEEKPAESESSVYDEMTW